MPWCPKCKLEYRKGINKCTDCGEDLVDALTEEVSLVKIMSTPDGGLAQKFIDFLIYSNINSGEKQYDMKSAEYTVCVGANDEKQAKKLFQGFYITEVTNASVMEDEPQKEPDYSREEAPASGGEVNSPKETARELQRPAKVYVRREDKYKDLRATAQIFYVFGVLGFVFIAVNYFKIISFINGAFSYILYAALFGACLVVGAITQKSAGQAKAQIAEENQLTEMINQWLKEHITKAEMEKLYDDTLSEEINYLNQISHIKGLLLKEIENLDESYADQLIEDFYNANF